MLSLKAGDLSRAETYAWFPQDRINKMAIVYAYFVDFSDVIRQVPL